MKRLFSIILILGLLMALAQMILPGKLAAAMEKALQEQWEMQDVQVKIYAFPAIKILTGRIDRAEIFVGSAVFGMVPVNDLYIELKEVRIDVVSALQRDINYEMQRAGTVKFKITEQGLNDYLKDNPISGLGNVTIELSEDISTVKSQVTVLGSKVDLALLGRFTLKNGSLAFLPEDFGIDKHSLGDLFRDRFKAGTNLEITIGTLPYDTELHSLETGENIITFYGTIGSRTARP